jgi:ADP-ribosylation factor GTPase-activating protein 2/3
MLVRLPGVFLCLDCSSTHRNMGVHLTFVRSTDLDEWTQRQLDAMKLGGNGNAKTFFRKHGYTDFEGKSETKYKSKAAVAYKAELKKLVDAEAAKRGEIVEGAAVQQTGNLLENLEINAQADEQAEARAKLSAARTSAGTLTATATLASQNTAAKGKLSIAAVGGLRKPQASSTSYSMMKKPTAVKTSLNVKKMTLKMTSAEAGFEDIEATQKANADAEAEAKRLKEEAKIAENLQFENSAVAEPEPAVAPTPAKIAAPITAPVTLPKPVGPPKPPASTMQSNMAKLSAMNGDFFSDF